MTILQIAVKIAKRVEAAQVARAAEARAMVKANEVKR